MKTTLLSRYGVVLVTLIVFGLGDAQSTRVDDPTNDTTSAPTNEMATAPANEPTNTFRSIAIRDCVERALQNNFDIKIQRINPSIDTWGVVFQQGTFDPKLSGSVNYQDNTSPTGAVKSAMSTEATTLSEQLSLSGNFVSGATYDLSASPTRHT